MVKYSFGFIKSSLNVKSMSPHYPFIIITLPNIQLISKTIIVSFNPIILKIRGSNPSFSKLMKLEQFSITIGVRTNKFMAPEIIPEEDDFNEKIDVYSFGVLVY